MTPDELPADMEGRLEAHANGALIADIYGGSFADRFDRYQADLRALLKAYQERGRALEELIDYADEVVARLDDHDAGIMGDEPIKAARAALTGREA